MVTSTGILNSSFTVQTSFTWGLDLSGSLEGAGGVGGLLFIGNFPSPVGYYATAYDGNGNVTALTSMTDGTLAAQYEYGPFGEVIRKTGAMADADPFRFSTKYEDDQTGLLYYGYRYYTASTGRWLSGDPIGEIGGNNLYGMAWNDAIDYVDPLGLARACKWKIYAAHGLTDPEMSLIDRFQSINWARMPDGDAVAFVGCLANQLNSEVVKRYGDHGIPVPPASPDSIESDKLSIANQRLKKSGIVLTTGDYEGVDDLPPRFTGAREAAETACKRDGCSCKTITLSVNCTTAFARVELEQRASETYTDTIGNKDHNKWLKEAIERLKKEHPEKILCGRSATLDCKTGEWSDERKQGARNEIQL